MGHVVVKYNRPSTFGLTGVDPKGQSFLEHNLKSGVNAVPEEIWKKHENHPIVQAMIEEGDLEVARPKVGVQGYLQTLNVSEAIRTVKITIDPAILTSWMHLEKRKNVLKSIEKQIKDLNTPPEYRDRNQSMEDKVAEANKSAEQLNPDFTSDEE